MFLRYESLTIHQKSLTSESAILVFGGPRNPVAVLLPRSHSKLKTFTLALTGPLLVVARCQVPGARRHHCPQPQQSPSTGKPRKAASRKMVKKRVLNPIPVLDEALLSEALRGEGIKEVYL